MDHTETFPFIEFKPNYQVMCMACRQTARIADELYHITAEKLLLDNITKWETIGIHIDTIAREFSYPHVVLGSRQVVEVHRRIGLTGANLIGAAQFEFCFKYDKHPHGLCPFGDTATVLMNVEDNPPMALGII